MIIFNFKSILLVSILGVITLTPFISFAGPRPGGIIEPYDRCFRLGLNNIPVYYSKSPQSYYNPNFIKKESICITPFANKIEQFTAALNTIMRSSNGVVNSSSGNFTPIILETKSASTCPTTPSYVYNTNKDFAIRFDTEGLTVRAGVKLCRNYATSNYNDKLRLIAVIINTIEAYYPNSHRISNYTILDKYNNCINDNGIDRLCKPYPTYTIN
jgi:hypothetical protein